MVFLALILLLDGAPQLRIEAFDGVLARVHGGWPPVS
jgi:hypothetical protein